VYEYWSKVANGRLPILSLPCGGHLSITLIGKYNQENKNNVLRENPGENRKQKNVLRDMC
jgi:fatty acid-binding protein DegV